VLAWIPMQEISANDPVFRTVKNAEISAISTMRLLWFAKSYRRFGNEVNRCMQAHAFVAQYAFLPKQRGIPQYRNRIDMRIRVQKTPWEGVG
jgi:hypothetical protein